jgi:hypothetical protein
MLADMEEKYSALRQAGKSEHEAAYGVIADFGSMEEIQTELGLEAKTPEESLFISEDEAEIYLRKGRQSGIITGIGVWLILAGVSSTVFLDGNVLPMFIAIAVAVTMFIMNHGRVSKYEKFDDTTIRLDKDVRERLEEKRAAFNFPYTAMIAGGVALIIIAVGVMAVMSESYYSVVAFLNIVGFSVFMFIVAGTYSTYFDALLGKGGYEDKATNKKSDHLIGTIAAIYWPAVSALGILLLFLGVEMFWLSWVIGGIVFGGICGGISVWAERKKN